MAMQIKTKTALVMVVASLVAACAGTPGRLVSAEQYSRKVQTQLEEGDLRAAESTLGEMELYHPVSAPTQAMQLKLINAYYRAAEMDAVVLAARRYVSLFPRADDLDQVHYLSGMANYDRGLQSLGDSPREKSPLHALAAKASFSALLRCCVESRYAGEASERVAYLDESLAHYEFGLMRAELLKGNVVAATTKGNNIIAAYPTTSAAGVTEVMLASLDKPEVLDRLLIATALILNQDEVEAIAEKAGMAMVETVVARAEITPAMNETAAADVEAPAAKLTVASVAATAPVATEVVAETTSSTAEAAPARPMLAVNLTTAPKRYTVQLGSSRKLKGVQRYMQRLGLADVASYELRMVNGEQWHAAFYGAYADRFAAQRAADELMAYTGAKDLWVRRLADVKVEPRTLMAVSEPAKARLAETAKARAVEAAVAQTSGKYAIQVASEQSLDALKATMRGMKLEGQIEYYRRVVDNRAIYSALYGTYADLPSARAGLSGLQERINKSGLWIRAIDESQRVAAE